MDRRICCSSAVPFGGNILLGSVRLVCDAEYFFLGKHGDRAPKYRAIAAGVWRNSFACAVAVVVHLQRNSDRVHVCDMVSNRRRG